MPSLVKRNPDDPNNPYRAGQIVDGQVRCGAKKKNGEICMRTDLIGQTRRCRLHGGKTPNGFAFYKTVSGKYSKYLPEDLSHRYEELLSNPDLEKLRDEIALIDTRISLLTESVDDNASDAHWKRLRTLWARFMDAVRTGDETEQNRLLPLINSAIMQGCAERENWKDIERLVDLHRRLSDSHARTLEKAGHFLTVEQAVMLATAIISSIKEAAFRYAEPTVARHILTDAQRSYNELVGAFSTPNDP